MKSKYAKFIKDNKEKIALLNQKISGAVDITNYIQQVMFYKHLSAEIEKLVRSVGISDMSQWNEFDDELVEYTNSRLGYFIPSKYALSLSMNSLYGFGREDFNLSMSVLNRLSTDEAKRDFDIIFYDIQRGLGRLGETTKQVDHVLHKIISSI